jgi:copper resistance protein B
MNALHRCLFLAALLPWTAHAAGVPQTHAHHAMKHGMSGMQDMPGMEKPAAAPSIPEPSGPAPHAKPPNDHVPPAPPRRVPSPMSPAHMAGAMQMDDHAMHGMLLFDRLERRLDPHGDNATAWSAQAWLGGDIDRLWLDSEGERGRDGTRDAYVEALWGHAVAAFWDTRLGVRHDVGRGPAREWLAFGVEGLAPYWFEVNATLYAGPQGRTAARVGMDYDLLFTQRLILRPSLELNAYGKDDPRRGMRAGLADAELGLRLRYEFSRRFAPYLGVSWTRRPGGDGRLPPWRRPEPEHEFAWLAGLRFWF